MQNNRNRSGARRALYDQAKDEPRARRTSRQRRGASRSGYREQTINLGEVQYVSGDVGGSGRRNRAQPPPSRDPARRERRKKRRLTRAQARRRRFARRLTAFVLLAAVIAAGVYLTITMLFKVNSIVLQNAEGAAIAEAGGYTSEQILGVLGVKQGDNIFSFDPAEKEKLLEKQFPLLENIEIIRRYPTNVWVRVSEAQPAWCIQTENGWLTVSSGLKIIGVEAAQPALPTLYGGEVVSPASGEQLAFAPQPSAESASGASESESESTAAGTDSRLEALKTLLAALESRGMLAEVTRIEFADTEQAAFLYQNRISVLLGTLNELDYKLDFANYLLLNTDGKGCAPTDTGSLDCSHVRSDGTLRPILAQGAPSLPSGYIVTAESAAAQGESAAEAPAPSETDPAAEAPAQTEAEAAPAQ